MKKHEVLLAEMQERKSRSGNSYYYGASETGGRFLMHKVVKGRKGASKPMWILKFTNN